jgi:hypothetical protein
MKAIAQAVADAYDDCIAVAKDFTGQGVAVREILERHKAKALKALDGSGKAAILAAIAALVLSACCTYKGKHVSNAEAERMIQMGMDVKCP